jgi:hypothetical protein
MARHRLLRAESHPGGGGQGNERSESEMRRPEGEASYEPAPRSADLDGRLRGGTNSALTWEGDVGAPARVTLRVTTCALHFGG